MKIRSAMKKYCQHCYIVTRGKKIMVKCKVDPRHKQRQGFCSIQQSETNNVCSMPSLDGIYAASKINTSCMMYFPLSKMTLSSMVL